MGMVIGESPLRSSGLKPYFSREEQDLKQENGSGQGKIILLPILIFFSWLPEPKENLDRFR
jgi:hypothetical protein